MLVYALTGALLTLGIGNVNATTTVSAGGNVVGGNITTVGTQTYSGPVVLAADATLSSLGQNTTTTYNYSASVQNVTISGSSVTVTLVGGGGGVGGNDGCCTGMGGGLSGSYTATLSVTPGTTLQLAPGAGGSAGTCCASSAAGGAGGRTAVAVGGGLGGLPGGALLDGVAEPDALHFGELAL